VEILVPDSLSIAGLPALVGELEGTYKGDPLKYRLALIEGDSMLYQVVCWSSLQQFAAYEPDARQMIESFLP
jgi:hypothetical protein